MASDPDGGPGLRAGSVNRMHGLKTYLARRKSHEQTTAALGVPAIQ
jgi:hypothetical protein